MQPNTTIPTGDALRAFLLTSQPLTPLVTAMFARDGLLAAAGFLHRPSQSRLAEMIARRIDSGGWGLAEAPCGTGKSLAYLVPGILAAVRADLRRGGDEDAPRERLVVSTANIQLQDQLRGKDVPAVARLLGLEVRVTVAKGRRNWICRRALADASRVGIDQTFQVVKRLGAWADTPGCTGDREDVPFPANEAWGRVSIDGEDCDGDGCRFFDTCFSERARAQMASAHVIICNHHWLALAGESVSPSPLLVVDEAHALEDALRAAGRIELRVRGVRRLAKSAEELWEEGLILGAPVREAFEEPVGRIIAEAQRLLSYEPKGTDRLRLDPGWSELDATELLRAPQVLRAALQDRGEALLESNNAQEAKKYLRVAERISRFVWRCKAVLAREPARPPCAVWVERDPEGEVTVLGCNVDAAPGTAALQEFFPTAALVSATLAPSGSFDSVRFALGFGEVGAPETQDETGRRILAGPVEELVLPSPWPLERMGVLVVPRLAPRPKDPAWQGWVVEQVVRVVRFALGRTLVLCSSMRSARACAEGLRAAELPWSIRLQGEAGRGELREWFRSDVHGVLVGTRSFFEGMDIAGEACSAVILDRIPFEVPDEPLEHAICRYIDEILGESSFDMRSIPKACAVLAQGGGRLIRSEGDRGAIVLLDARYHDPGPIGEAVRAAFPPFPVSMDLEDVRRVLAGEQLSLSPAFVSTLAPEPPRTKTVIRIGGKR